MFNRKERLQISKKFKSNKGKPTRSGVNWRLRNNEKKCQREKQLFMELDEKNRHDDEDKEYSNTHKKAKSQIGNQKTWYSLSVALPGSILNNIQTKELKAYVTGQLARTFAIFCVDEVIIFDEMARMTETQVEEYYSGDWRGNEPIRENNSECNFHMARVFEYLECPQYLRKQMFPIHSSLQYAGLLNPLDAMHHLRSTDLELSFREGIVLDKPSKNGQRCDVGLDQDLILTNSERIPPHTRITVKMDTANEATKRLKGTLSSPNIVRGITGVYWGYSVRLARSLSEAIMAKSYDFIIGTSEKGSPMSELPIPRKDNCKILVVFGGLAGLEAAVKADQSIEQSDPADFFPNYVNCLPDQGSRVIRTEEAIPICLTGLKYKLDVVVSD